MTHKILIADDEPNIVVSLEYLLKTARNLVNKKRRSGDGKLLDASDEGKLLDAARKAEVLPYLATLGDSGVPIVYVTHSLEEAARLADHTNAAPFGTAGSPEGARMRPKVRNPIPATRPSYRRAPGACRAGF